MLSLGNADSMASAVGTLPTQHPSSKQPVLGSVDQTYLEELTCIQKRGMNDGYSTVENASQQAMCMQ